MLLSSKSEREGGACHLGRSDRAGTRSAGRADGGKDRAGGGGPDDRGGVAVRSTIWRRLRLPGTAQLRFRIASTSSPSAEGPSGVSWGCPSSSDHGGPARLRRRPAF